MASNGQHVSALDSADRKTVVNKRNVNQTILNKFWTISESSPTKRSESIRVILDILAKQIATNTTSDLNYCVERVVRGLSSARQFARHGFSVLFTQMINTFSDEISLEFIFSLATTNLGNIEEVSNHDSVIGWSLVMASILKSDRLTADVDHSILKQVFEVLYTLGIKKPYIELVVCELMKSFVALISSDKVLVRTIIWSKLETDLKVDKIKPFLFYTFLIIRHYIPDLCKKHECMKTTKSKNYDILASVIKETTGYHPLVHPMNCELIKMMIVDKSCNFSQFWNQIVENQLFTPNQIEKGFLGFELIKIALPLVKDKDDIAVIISASFLRLFIQSLSLNNNPLNTAAKNLCENIINYSKECDDSYIQLAILNSFIQPPGSLMFDEISKTKFFSNLLKSLNEESTKEWIEKLLLLFVDTDKIDSNDILRIRCVQQILILSKSFPSKDNKLIWTVVKFFLFHSYFEAKDDTVTVKFAKTREPITEKLRNACKDNFRNAFNFLTSIGSKTTKEKLISESEAFLSLVKYVDKLVKTDNILCSTYPKISDSWNSILKIILKLSKKIKKTQIKQNEIRIFIILYSLFALQLFEEFDIKNFLPDLKECMKRAINEEIIDSKEELSYGWADVMTDIILSMLANCSKLSRNVFSFAFKLICVHMTDVGLQQLITAINPSSDEKLFLQNGDSESDDEEVNEENQESDSDSDSESDDNIKDTELDENFRNDIMNALGPAAQNDDEESVYLSDNEMFQIDDSLAAVFQSKFNNKKEAQEKELALQKFRFRCFELIKLFIEQKEPNLMHLLLLINPIINVTKSSFNSKPNQSYNSYTQVLHQISKIKDFKTVDVTVSLENFQQIFNNVLNVLMKSTHIELQKPLNSLCVWLVLISKRLFENNCWYIPILKDSLQQYFEKNNNHLSANLFISIIATHNDIGLELVDILVKYIFSEQIRTFKKSASLEILIILCRNNKNEKNLVENKNLIDLRDKAIKELRNQLENEKPKISYISELIRLMDIIEICFNNANQKNPKQELHATLTAISKQTVKSFNKKTQTLLKGLINSNK